MKRSILCLCLIATASVGAKEKTVTINNKSSKITIDVWQNCAPMQQPKLLKTIAPSTSAQVTATQDQICFYGYFKGTCNSSAPCYSIDYDSRPSESCDCGLSTDNPTQISDGDIIDVVIPPSGGPSRWKINKIKR
ncbi:MAG: hypothetical protein ACHQVS_02105 [Candidatus Babeliales bacterium]